MEVPGDLRSKIGPLQSEIESLLEFLRRPLKAPDILEGWTPQLQEVVIKSLEALQGQLLINQVSRQNLARDLDTAGIVGGSRFEAVAKISAQVLELYDAIASR